MLDPWFYRRNTVQAIYHNRRLFLTLIVVFAVIVIGLNKYYTDKNAIPEGESILLPYVNSASQNETIAHDSL